MDFCESLCDDPAALAARIRKYTSEKYNFYANMFVKNLTPLQQGLAYALVILSLMQCVNLLINYTFLLIILYNLLSLLMTIFCIFSIFTWLHLYAGPYLNLNETHVYLIFLTCFISEFFIQFFTFNLKTHLQTTSATTTSSFPSSTTTTTSSVNGDEASKFTFMVESFQQVVIISVTCSFTFFCSNIRQSQYASLVLVICLTRFYGTVYLSFLLPLHVCPYLTYFCALSGILFSKYVEATFNMSIINSTTSSCSNSNNNNNTQKSTGINNKTDGKSQRANYFCSRCNANLSLLSKSVNMSTSNLNKSNRRKLTSSSISSNSNSTLVFKRRSSLPTIPIINDKVNLHFYL